MFWLLHVIAQQSPDISNQWPGLVTGALGGGGPLAAALWKIHLDDRAENKALTSRLFLLADRAAEVSKTAAEVVKNEPTDPELLAAMSRVEALLQERSR